MWFSTPAAMVAQHVLGAVSEVEEAILIAERAVACQ